MDKKTLKEYQNNFKVRIPKQEVTVIHVYGKNIDKMRQYLAQPYDIVYDSIFTQTTQEIAKTIDGCIYAFNINDEAVFVCHNKQYQTPFMNNDAQRITSIIASHFSVLFYNKFISFNISYASKIEEENYNEKDLDVLNQRLNNLWKSISEIPVFYTEVFSLPEEDEFALIEKLQDDNIDRTINQMSKIFMEKTEGISNEIILKVLDKKGNSWFETSEQYRFGSGYFKREIDGQSFWTEFNFRTEKAERYSAKNKNINNE